MRIRIVAVAAALAVAGCATVTENTLTQARRDALRIDSVEVAMAPKGFVSWASAWGEYATMKQNGQVLSGPSSSGYADEKQYANQKAIGIIQKNLNAKIPPQFRGTDAATLKVNLKQVQIPHALQTILIGGDHVVRAHVQLIDSKTGAILLDVEDFNGLVGGPGGVAQVVVDQFMGEPIDRVSNSFANALAQWLKTGAALASSRQS
jgi:hypothetical protein